MEDLALASEEDNDDDVSGMYNSGQLAEGASSSDCEAAEFAEAVASKSESKSKSSRSSPCNKRKLSKAKDALNKSSGQGKCKGQIQRTGH